MDIVFVELVVLITFSKVLYKPIIVGVAAVSVVSRRLGERFHTRRRVLLADVISRRGLAKPLCVLGSSCLVALMKLDLLR